MISYASKTHGQRNLAALSQAGWRLLLSPGRGSQPQPGFRFACDNGAWSCFTRKEPFDTEGFTALVEEHGAAADFIVIPDIVASPDSWEFSRSWLDRLKHFRLILWALQDGMRDKDVGALLERHPNMGLFLGGSVDWKLRTMYGWGMVAHAFRRYYHVGRVNSVRRIRLCQEAGADSFDGTSASMYSVNVPKLTAARNQPHLLTPESGASAR